MQKTILLLVLLSILVIHGPGCSSAPVEESDPASLFKDAEEDIESDHYQIAIEKLRAIKNKFPYSKYAVEAQLRIADVYYLQESFGDAAASYESFKDLHPKHEKVAYAMFRVGKSYLSDTPSPVARDISSAQKALDAYMEFVNRFPKASEVEEAKTDIKKIRELLAAKELTIGDFYYKRDLYDSAKPRYKKVIELYPDTEAAKQAEATMGQIK